MRKILKLFFEIPNMLESTLKYVEELEKEHEIVSHIMQSKWWKEKKSTFGGKIVFPIYIYQDEYETNNPLGSHRGLGKVAGVYLIISCLPPSLQSKTENIFVFELYKTDDLHNVSIHDMFVPIIQELKYLETSGIEVKTSNGKFQIFFSLAKIIGDNLAVHQMLGFSQCFSANFPCRFCKIHYSDISQVCAESQCILRTEETYNTDLDKMEMSTTGICGESVFNSLESTSTLQLMTVEPAHDILEGVFGYDIGLCLHHFIFVEKYFTLDNLNERLQNLFKDNDESSNKPPSLKSSHVRNKAMKMSACEMLCFVRNIGVLIGDFIPRNEPHWKLIILLKSILDIVVSPYVHSDLAPYFQTLISEYLSSLNELHPNHAKIKHHLLIHYPRLMATLGPLWAMNTLRCESKHQESKNAANVSRSRVNICKTLAIKCQLRLNYRFIMNEPVQESPYEKGTGTVISFREIEGFDASALNCMIDPNTNIVKLDQIIFRSKNVRENTILCIPTDDEPEMYVVKHLVQTIDTEILHIFVNDITPHVVYDEHYQAYEVHDCAFNNILNQKCLFANDLKSCHVSQIVKNSTNKYIVRRWI